MSMSVAEARSEIKNLFEQADLIEKKYPDGVIANNEDEAEVKRLLGEIDGLEGKLAGLEDSEARKARILGGLDRYSKPAPKSLVPGAQAKEIEEAMTVSPGDQFVQSREYRQMKLDGHFNSALARVNFAVQLKDGTSLMQWKRILAQKGLLYGSSETSGGGFVQNDRQPGYLELLQREINVMDLIPRVTTDSDTVEYVEETAFTNAAAMVAEATATTGSSGKKPESTLAYKVQTSPVRTLAHWLPVTNRMLADAPAIRGIINGRLLLGLELELEDQVLNGSGAGENFEGIMEVDGIGELDSGDNLLDAIFRARTAVRVDGRGRPNAVIMHPSDWEYVRLAREDHVSGIGQYLMGPPSQVGASTLWGIPVIESEAIDEGYALVGDFTQGCTLFDRTQASVRVGTIDDQFIRNMQTILAELRAAFVVWRPAMFAAVTGIGT